jgi:beta/gamma crystallin
MAHIILYKDDNFHGLHKHVFASEPDLNNSDETSILDPVAGDRNFNDAVSSLVVVEQNWLTFDDANYQPPKREPAHPVLGPGLYSYVGLVGILNDSMSSLETVDNDPTVVGAPLDNHVILFEHAHFRGRHKHVFTAEPALDEQDQFGISSIAVLKGNWEFYGEPGLYDQSKYPPVLGPGGYPFVGDVQIANDGLESLQPTSARPTVQSLVVVDQGVFLFEHQYFHGNHRHVVDKEPNLNAPEDNDFNDKGTQSLVVRDRQWYLYRDWNLQNPYPVAAIPAQYSDLSTLGIHEDLSSLQPVGP